MLNSLFEAVLCCDRNGVRFLVAVNVEVIFVLNSCLFHRLNNVSAGKVVYALLDIGFNTTVFKCCLHGFLLMVSGDSSWHTVFFVFL